MKGKWWHTIGLVLIAIGFLLTVFVGFAYGVLPAFFGTALVWPKRESDREAPKRDD